MASNADSNSLFEIDAELDGLLEDIQEAIECEGEASEELIARFRQFDGVLWETVISHLPDGLADALEASIQETNPDTEAIKAAVLRQEEVPGADVRRGSHLRVA
jgi:hypothetical protein